MRLLVKRLLLLSGADIYDTADPTDTWWHIMDNVQHNAHGTQRFQSCGRFNMPDMLTIGQGGQSIDEYKSQMALWTVMASPLINGADIRNLRPAHLAILTNKALLEINRDPMCTMGGYLQSSLSHSLSLSLSASLSASLCLSLSVPPRQVDTDA